MTLVFCLNKNGCHFTDNDFIVFSAFSLKHLWNHFVTYCKKCYEDTSMRIFNDIYIYMHIFMKVVSLWPTLTWYIFFLLPNNSRLSCINHNIWQICFQSFCNIWELFREPTIPDFLRIWPIWTGNEILLKWYIWKTNCDRLTLMCHFWGS